METESPENGGMSDGDDLLAMRVYTGLVDEDRYVHDGGKADTQ